MGRPARGGTRPSFGRGGRLSHAAVNDQRAQDLKQTGRTLQKAPGRRHRRAKPDHPATLARHGFAGDLWREDRGEGASIALTAEIIGEGTDRDLGGAASIVADSTLKIHAIRQDRANRLDRLIALTAETVSSVHLEADRQGICRDCAPCPLRGSQPAQAGQRRSALFALRRLSASVPRVRRPEFGRERAAKVGAASSTLTGSPTAADAARRRRDQLARRRHRGRRCEWHPVLHVLLWRLAKRSQVVL